jgi:hypothetical protein
VSSPRHPRRRGRHDRQRQDRARVRARRGGPAERRPRGDDRSQGRPAQPAAVVPARRAGGVRAVDRRLGAPAPGHPGPRRRRGPRPGARRRPRAVRVGPRRGRRLPRRGVTCACSRRAPHRGRARARAVLARAPVVALGHRPRVRARRAVGGAVAGAPPRRPGPRARALARTTCCSRCSPSAGSARARRGSGSRLHRDLDAPRSTDVGALDVDDFLRQKARARSSRRRSTRCSRRRRWRPGARAPRSTSAPGSRPPTAARRRWSSAWRTSTTTTARWCSGSCWTRCWRWVRATASRAPRRLRALVVFDEVYGFLPPHPAPPRRPSGRWWRC